LSVSETYELICDTEGRWCTWIALCYCSF